MRQAVAAGGVLMVANHSAHYDSAALYIAADRLGIPLHFMAAWQVFAQSSRWEQWLMQRLGTFSVDREGIDRQAFKQAIAIVQSAPHPLVVFPEGDIYHTTDHVTPFREGAAAVALAAARRAERPVSVVPCGIKFWYTQDPTPELLLIMEELERRVLLRPSPQLPLSDRIHRLAEAVLALKELDFLGYSRSGRVRDRIAYLIAAVLSPLEREYLPELTSIDQEDIPERVKTLRQEIISRINGYEKNGSSAKLRTLQSHMEDLFFVMQLYSYPGTYLAERPTLERIAETIDKFEEDILDLELPRVRGRRRIVIRFGEPLPVPKEKGKRDNTASFTRQMHQAVQQLVEQARVA